MLQTNPISVPAAPAPAADLAPQAPTRSPRPVALRTEDGIAAAAGGASAAKGRTAASVRKAKGSATSKASASGYAKASSQGDFGFLRDPKLTLEQKLMRFMIVMAKKLDEDIQRRMEELAPKDPKKTSSSKTSSSKKSSKGGLFGNFVSSILKGKPLKDLLKQVAGPVLAAGASALGFPALAPLLLKAGPALAQVVGDLAGSLADAAGAASGGRATGDAAGSSSRSSSATGKTGASGMDATEERVKMMELQSVLEKQKEMVTLVSNMLRTFHDMRMSAIHNIR
jgi:hypothetical protein